MASPLTESTYGSPPYHESALKAALRMLAQSAPFAMQGLGAVRPGSNFGDAFLQSSGAASRAAQEYAMKQQEAARQRENDQFNNQYKMAMIKQLERPEKPEKPEKVDVWNRPPDEIERYLELKKREEALRPKAEKSSDGKPKLSDLNTMSDNFRQDKDVQNFTVVRDNYKRINSTLGLKSGFGDLGAIFSYMRVLDPNSVVRETEFKNAEQAVGYVQKTYNLPQWWFKGARLTDAGRKAIGQASRSLYEAQKKTYDSKTALFKRQAKSYGVDPTLVIPDYGDDAGDPLDAFYK